MLPASFQTPAALILLVGGLISCFLGYRVFRFVLGFFGFVLGALLASSVMGTEETLWMIGAAIAGGIVGSLILIAAYFVGVALIGAGVGALLANLIWASLGREPHIVIVILFAIAAFGGAWTAIVGALALLGDRLAVAAAARNDVWLAYPMNPAPGQRWVTVVWLVVGLTGVIVQLSLTAKGKK